MWSDGDKIKRADEEANPAGMCEALSGAGIPKDNDGGDHRVGRRFQQQLPEYFPCKGRRTDRACAVHV